MRGGGAPRWATALLRLVAPKGRADDVLGDLEESHRRRAKRRGRWVAGMLTGLEGLDVAFAVVRERARGRRREREPTDSRRLASRGGGPRFNMSWLDVKLGFRMLLKYPGLTVIGGVAIALSIWVGASFFEFVTQVIHPRLPLDDGDQIVGIVLRDASTTRAEPRALHDLKVWRVELVTVQELGAFRTVQRNLTVQGRGGEALNVAEVTASAFQVNGEAETCIPRLRGLAAALDPTLRLQSIMPVDEARADDISFYAFLYRITVMVRAVALFLALAGIYAVMAFTVSRRTREIGRRVALGSDKRRAAASILRRPLAQLGLGIALGMVWTSWMAAAWEGGDGFFAPRGAALVAAYALLMLGVCLLACIVPARRALAVEPTDALRAEG